MDAVKKGLTLFNKEMKEDDLGDVNGEASDTESELESKIEEDVKLTEPSKNSVYNRDGLLEKLVDISWPENLEWVHKLSVNIDQEQEVDVNDDLARELAFYTQALEGTRQGFEKLQSMGLPFLRPSDYYAEMVKTDAHMGKVKGRLLVEKRNMEEAEERRKTREAKKISKEVQAQKLKERAKQKKEEIESVKKWRKQRQQSGFAVTDKDDKMGFPFEDEKGFERSNKRRTDKDDKTGFPFEDGKGFERSNKRRPGVTPGDRSGGKARLGGGKGKKGTDKKRKNRDHRDSKFGFGGRKTLRKQNTAETTNDYGAFNKVVSREIRRGRVTKLQKFSILVSWTPYFITMFDSTVELITLAASNSLLIFCFCNLIIVFLLIGGSKSESPSDKEGGICVSTVTKRIEKEEKGGHDALSFNDTEASFDTLISNNGGYDDDDGEDEDDLRRRVEEFIDKVNRGWKAEMVRTSPYPYRANLQGRNYDSIFFSKGCLDQAAVINEVLRFYGTATGQLINKRKSGLFLFPNTPHRFCRIIGRIFHCNILPRLVRYLGIPMQFGSAKSMDFQTIVPLPELYGPIPLWSCTIVLKVFVPLLSAHNEKLFSQYSCDPLTVLSRASAFAIEARSVWPLVTPKPPNSATSFWEPPMAGFIKINCDGAFVHQGSSGGATAMGRDSVERVVDFRVQVSACGSSIMAKAKAICLGILLASESRWKNIIVESDSLNHILALNSSGVSFPLDVLILMEDLKASLNEFDHVSFSFIPRSLNELAHWLATLSLSQSRIGNGFALPSLQDIRLRNLCDVAGSIQPLVSVLSDVVTKLLKFSILVSWTPNFITMFDSTVELIILAASNSLLVFCFCNLIIVFLLIGGSKPESPSDKEGGICVSTVTKRIEKEEKGRHDALSFNDTEASFDTLISNNGGDDDDDGEDEDDLRRRVEEFIDKVNRGWKAEMVQSSPIFIERICKGGTVM
ncbi:hypothetical protein HHK36_028759 [Tetracentron sinense]|uniref:RNase H type-1 domain-containing protein n=1 Tax=Tetracentron sinense TaxID=13715 RepID=A0A834YFL9_TETSI|nr:hypothetical protein HHK36_028759 [Tetracentron sinense]